MYVPLKLPPGVARSGTKYDSRGRWFDASLVRWHEGKMMAINGWQQMLKYVGLSVADLDLGEAVRGMFGWRQNDNTANIALGTATKAYAYSAGALTDITPAGFVAGEPSAVPYTGTYGNGPYSGGGYGSGFSISTTIVEAQSWCFDAFGQYLLGCAYSDGKLYKYDPTTPATPFTVLAGAPINNLGVIVTPERFVVALAAGGDKRVVQWADQESLTDWTPTATNQAGDFTLVGSGAIMAGVRGKNETLIWTDTDLYAMRYIGGSLIYRFQQVGSGCGLAGRRSLAMEGGRAWWMGVNGFFVYDGQVRAVPCDVYSFVFDNLNRTQISKVAAVTNTAYNEVTWFYPSTAGSECDRYVTYNYLEQHWTIGALTRTAGVDSGIIDSPIYAAANGKIYEHEVIGAAYPDSEGGADLVPYAESGPVEIGDGDRVLIVRGLIPDEDTLGDVQIKLYTSLFPTATESVSSAFTPANPTAIRKTGRWARLRLDQVNIGWKFGTPRLDVVPGGRR